MLKKSVLITILVLFVCAVSFSKDGHEHDKDIASLFYDKYYAENLLNQSRTLSDCLTPALFLTLDYCKGKEDRGIKCRLNLSGYAITLTDEEMVLICTPGSSSHEVYSHLGWDCDYTNTTFPLKADSNFAFFHNDNWRAWATRKKLLVEAVAKVFDFSGMDSRIAIKKISLQKEYHPSQRDSKPNIVERQILSMTSKTESMAAILYYAHILGDIEANRGSTDKTRIDLTSLCKDLEKHLVNLFGNKAVKKYTNLCISLQVGVSAEDVLKALQGAFPGLLDGESFYEKTEIKRAVDILLWQSNERPY